MLIEDVNNKEMLYDPFSKVSIKKLKKDHKEFDKKLDGLDIDKIISYIILYYDFKSNLRIELQHHTRFNPK